MTTAKPVVRRDSTVTLNDVYIGRLTEVDIFWAAESLTGDHVYWRQQRNASAYLALVAIDTGEVVT